MKPRERDDAIKTIEKKPQRLPLVKNFFIARVDTELMGYPEAIYENDDLDMAKQRKKEYEDFLETNIYNNPDDLNNIRKLKEFGAFRTRSSLVTESMLSFNEPESRYLSYSTFLSQHQQILKLIYDYGNEYHKLTYAPKLETGELTAVPCFFETSAFKTGKKIFNTAAKFKDSKDKWILNGEKSFVLLSPAYMDSTLFLVIATIETTDYKGDFSEGITTMLVDANSPGVTISRVDKTIGFAEKVFNQVTVTFKDVEVDKSKKSSAVSSHLIYSDNGFPL